MRRSILFQRRAAGFTVIELTISLLVMVVVMLGMLALFDFSNKLSHVQTNLADMQQSQRVAQQDVIRTIRMLGRGPIPLGSAANGVGISVWDQVPEDTHIGGDGSEPVVPGTDIVTVRGVFSSPVYQINALAPGTYAIQTEDGGASSGYVEVSSMSPTSIPQDLQALKDAVNSDKPERLVLVSARNLDRWSIVAIDPDSPDNIVSADSVRVAFKTLSDLADPPPPPEHFVMPTGDDPKDFGAVAFVGVLEEHRFYIRQEFKTAPNGTQDLASMFTRARVYPGTDLPWRGPDDDDDVEDDAHPSWRVDVADNIVDLQVALGFNTPNGGSGDSHLFESADGVDDDWLYNNIDEADPSTWVGDHRLLFIRLTTLARTDRRDTWYQSPPLVRVEDHDLTTSQFNSETDRMFRYRPLQTFIDMRNLN